MRVPVPLHPAALSWGSLPDQASQGPQFPLTNVRAGQHTCFDRLVIDLGRQAGGYHVGYVPEVLRQGSGLPVPLRGGAFLDVTLHTPTYDLNGRPTFSPTNESNIVAVGGFRTFRQVASGGSFEGYTTFGLGVRAVVVPGARAAGPRSSRDWWSTSAIGGDDPRRVHQLDRLAERHVRATAGCSAGCSGPVHHGGASAGAVPVGERKDIEIAVLRR